MKQVYRYAAMLTVILVSAMCFTACDDDDDYYYGNPIVGDWQMVSQTGYFYNEFTFYPDGTGTYYVEDQYGSDTYYIQWDTYGSQLTVDFPNQMDTMYFNWSVQGNTLYLYPDDGGNPWVYRAY